MQYELLKLHSNMMDMAWENCSRIEVLKGFCENFAGEKVSATTVLTLLEDILSKQKHFINYFDKESIRINML